MHKNAQNAAGSDGTVTFCEFLSFFTRKFVDFGRFLMQLSAKSAD
jgi:hypothetical protein